MQQLQVVYAVAMGPPELSPYFQRDFNEYSTLIDNFARYNYSLNIKT